MEIFYSCGTPVKKAKAFIWILEWAKHEELGCGHTKACSVPRRLSPLGFSFQHLNQPLCTQQHLKMCDALVLWFLKFHKVLIWGQNWRRSNLSDTHPTNYNRKVGRRKAFITSPEEKLRRNNPQAVHFSSHAPVDFTQVLQTRKATLFNSLNNLWFEQLEHRGFYLFPAVECNSWQLLLAYTLENRMSPSHQWYYFV